MNASSTLRKRRRLAATLLALLPPLASAQSYDFTGVFAPSMWDFSSGGSPAGVVWNGTSSFTLTGSDGANDSPDAYSSFTTLLLDLTDAYRVSFDWSYSTGDGALYDPAGYISSHLNSQLTDNHGNSFAQSGTASNVYFGAGTSGFYIFSTDNKFGEASITISNFSYTLADPGDLGDPVTDPDPGSAYESSTEWFAQNGNWAVPGKWSNGVPSSSAQAVILENSVVNITTATEAHSVYLESSALNITGDGSLTMANPMSNFVADYGAAFTVSGPDASWSNAGDLDLYTATATFDHGATGGTGNIYLALIDDNLATLTVRNGATLSGGYTYVGFLGRANFNIESGAAVTLGDTFVGYYSGSEGHLSVTGSGTTLATDFLQIATFSKGSLLISDGAVVTSTGADIASGSVSKAGDVIGSVTVTGNGSRWEIADDVGLSDYVSSSTYNTGTLTIADGGLVRIGASGTGTLHIQRGGTLNIGTGGAAGILQAGSVDFIAASGTAALIAFNHSDDLVFTPEINGRGRLTKAGAGTLTLTGTNDYTQNTTVTGGILQLGDGGTTGSITGTVAVSSGASLAFKRSNDYTFSGAISGAGSVIQNGSGMLTLSGSNTYTGGTRINAGTLGVSSNNNLGNATGDVTLAGGTLRLSSNTATNFNRAVTVVENSGIASNRTSNGAGVTHTLGTLTIGAQTLSITRGPNATSGTGGITFGATTLTGNATFDVGANARLTLGAISGDHGFTKTGAGNLTLTGANTFTGPLTIGAGTLALSSGASLSATTDVRIGSGATFDVSAVSGGYTVAAGNTLGGTGSFTGLVTLGAGAGISPGNSPGTLTFTGGLALNAGSFLDFELGTLSDLIRVSGGTLFGPEPGTITVNIFDSGDFVGGTYTLVDATGASLSGINADSFTVGTAIAGYDYSFQQSGNLFQLVATVAVPEPASFAALAGLGVLGFAASRRRPRA